MSNYITVLGREDFLREFENERSLFDDVQAVKSFFKNRAFISKGQYIEMLLYFIDGRHEKLLREGEYSADTAGLQGKYASLIDSKTTLKLASWRNTPYGH